MVHNGFERLLGHVLTGYIFLNIPDIPTPGLIPTASYLEHPTFVDQPASMLNT